MNVLPWLWPGLVISLGVAFVAGPRLGRELGAGRVAGTWIVVSLGLILSATLTPQSAALDFGVRSAGTCDLTLTVPSPSGLLAFNEITLNFLLFVPLGAALGVIAGSRTKVAMILAAVLLPFVIEWLQLALPVLDRACEASDVVYNLAGLGFGLAVAWLGGRISRDRARSDDDRSTRAIDQNG